MDIKKILTTIELLATTGIFSVGFSSWAIICGSSLEKNIPVNAENVIDITPYIEVKNIVMSDYGTYNNKRGFYTNFIYTEGTSNIAKVEYDIIFKYGEYFSNFYSNISELPNSLDVVTTLGFSDDMSNKYNIIEKSKTISNDITTYNISNKYGVGYNSISTNINQNGSLTCNDSSISLIYNVAVDETKKAADLSIYFSYSYTFTVEQESNETGISVSDYTNLTKGIPFHITISIEEEVGV